jgi:aminoglycoside phosphotransferase
VSDPGPEGVAGTIRILIGKADYRTGVAETFEYMNRLWAAGLRGEDGLGIPEPVAHLEELALLLQTEAPGDCLYDWLPTPAEGATAARNAGRFLARLHSLDLTGAKTLRTGYEVSKLGTYRDGLSETVPSQAERVAGLTNEVLNALVAIEGGPVVATHGDYQPKNIYVDGDRVTVIDWDRGALGHPGRDLGHFLGQCLTMSYVKSGTFEAVRPWNDAFLEGYVGTAPPGWEDAVGPYVARTILEVLYYKLVVKPVRDPSFFDSWLTQLAQSLAL